MSEQGLGGWVCKKCGSDLERDMEYAQSKGIPLSEAPIYCVNEDECGAVGSFDEIAMTQEEWFRLETLGEQLSEQNSLPFTLSGSIESVSYNMADEKIAQIFGVPYEFLVKDVGKIEKTLAALSCPTEIRVMDDLCGWWEKQIDEIAQVLTLEAMKYHTIYVGKRYGRIKKHGR